MAYLTGLPRWLQEMEQEFHTGARAFILTFNLFDYVSVPGEPPCRLRHFLANYLWRQGYELVVFFSQSAQCELVNMEDDPEIEERRHRQFQRYTGLDVPVQGPGVLQDSHDALPETVRVLPALTRLLHQGNLRAAAVIEYAHHLAPATQGMAALASSEQLIAVETFHGWGVDDRIRATENRVILLGQEGYLHELLVGSNSGYQQLTVKLPDESERQRFTQLCIDLRTSGHHDFGGLDEGLSIPQFANQTSGLRYVDLEKLFRTAGAHDSVVTRQDIRRCKAEAIRYMCGDLLEVLEPIGGFSEVSGLKHVIDYLTALKNRLHAGITDVPRALLFAGVPGVGKSFLVRAWAHELGYNCVAMRNVRSKWVGESEQNLERVFNCLLALQPCLCFIDEIDQALGQRGQGGDSGTSERMLSRIWEFIAIEEQRGQILWIGASNRPDLLDPATVDRFGIVIPFLHPTLHEVSLLLPVAARQLGHSFAQDVEINPIIHHLNIRCITVRALLDVVSMAAMFQDRDDDTMGQPIDNQHLLEAIQSYRPNANPLQHEHIALTAVQMTSFAHLLPWMAYPAQELMQYVPIYLQSMVDATTGQVDDEMLYDRLAELTLQLRYGNSHPTDKLPG